MSTHTVNNLTLPDKEHKTTARIEIRATLTAAKQPNHWRACQRETIAILLYYQSNGAPSFELYAHHNLRYQHSRVVSVKIPTTSSRNARNILHRRQQNLANESALPEKLWEIPQRNVSIYIKPFLYPEQNSKRC